MRPRLPERAATARTPRRCRQARLATEEYALPAIARPAAGVAQRLPTQLGRRILVIRQRPRVSRSAEHGHGTAALALVLTFRTSRSRGDATVIRIADDR